MNKLSVISFSMLLMIVLTVGIVPKVEASVWTKQPPFPDAYAEAWRGDHWPERLTWAANASADKSTGDMEAYIYSYIDVGGYLNVHFETAMCDFVYVGESGTLDISAVVSLNGHAHLYGICLVAGGFATGWSVEVWLVVDDLTTGVNLLNLKSNTWQDSDWGVVGDIVDRGTDLNWDYNIPQVSVPVEQGHNYKVSVKFVGWTGVSAYGIAATQANIGINFESEPFQMKLKWLTYDFSPNGGGGGCPYVYAWNGQRYVMDNNLLPASEVSNGADVEDYYKLEQLLVPIHQGTRRSVYSLQIREFENEHDYFDQVKLLAVDHSSDVNVAVSPYGEILTYSNPDPSISAVDENGADVQSLLSSVDQSYYQGYNGSYVTLTFAAIDVSGGAKLVIREDTPVFEKSPVYIKVLNATGDWNTVAVFHTRTYWATDIINMTGYLPDANGDLKVRFCFVSNDKIDYVGLDTTSQASIEVHRAKLISAFHSTQGNVKPLLTKNDQTYAELIPSEQIQLTFQLPNNQNQERTFIFYTEGHYETIA